MKKLQKLVLNKAKIMTTPQMKHITGGYDGALSCNSSCVGACDKGFHILGVCTTKFAPTGTPRCVCD
jgi:natural product precursor